MKLNQFRWGPLVIELRILSHYGEPPADAAPVQIDESGGTIGRGEGCSVVLVDPERRISRTHARVLYRDGGYHLIDQGTALPVIVNGRPLGAGNEWVLADGDQISIGEYVIGVAATSRPKEDPLQMFGSAAATNPFADLLQPAPGVPPAAKAAPAPKAAPGAGFAAIPADYDPFADLTPTSPPVSTTPLELGPGTRERSVDELFGLGPSPSVDPFASDALLNPAPTPGDAASLDPLVAFGMAQAQQMPPTTQGDATPEIRSTFRMPTANDAVAGEDMILSWEKPEEERGEIQSVLISSARREPAEPPPAVRPAPVEARPPAAVPEPVPYTPPVAPPPTVPAEQADALLQALLAGLGVPGLAIRGGVSPETMLLLGQLLREAMQGTLDLLLARATLKREIRADQTMIAPRENNPLKFSPNVEAALAHLLGAPVPGFMPPLAAMQDAYNDLRSHQVGFMAGMRAALEGVLQRFDPAQLEERLTQKSVIDTVLPMNRRAKLWDLFTERYSDISKEAQDDFQALFGKAFLRAYEAQIARLGKDDN